MENYSSIQGGGGGGGGGRGVADDNGLHLLQLATYFPMPVLVQTGYDIHTG